MARPLRIEYEDAVYHVTSPGNRRERIYKDDGHRNEIDRRFPRPALHSRQPHRETTRGETIMTQTPELYNVRQSQHTP